MEERLGGSRLSLGLRSGSVLFLFKQWLDNFVIRYQGYDKGYSYTPIIFRGHLKTMAFVVLD
jgi:hypothetical protein